MLDNPAAGLYTIKETIASVLPGNIIPAEDRTITVTAGENTAATMVNVVQAAPVLDGPEGGHTAAGGKFIVNHIPTDGQKPGTIQNPCEILNDVVVPAPVLQGPVGDPNGTEGGKSKEDGEEEDTNGR